MQRYDFTIRSKQEMLDVIDTFGFLPFFAGSIPGFSLEEHVAPELWYSHASDSWPVWEWKGPVIRESGCAYGKFFENKAVFISRDWFTHLANYRRDGYDFDARFDEGLASYRDKDLFDLIDRNAPVLTKQLKALGNYRKSGKKGFDTIITRLQAQCYVLISDFVYAMDKTGKGGVCRPRLPKRTGGFLSKAVYPPANAVSGCTGRGDLQGAEIRRRSLMLSLERATALNAQMVEEASLLLHEKNVCYAMGAMAAHFGEDPEHWQAIGMLHDYDYEKYPDEHLQHTAEPLRAQGVDEADIRAILSHGYGICTDVKPETNLEKSLFTVDELTGIIQACARMRPHGITDLEVKSFMKKFKDKRFAAKCDRALILQGCELLGMELRDVAAICIEGMKAHAQELGLQGTEG